ncbi:MAG: hypothetical protein J6A04_01570 [Clostridia bacterium]|nr:hypothetical protein [Clostridia bacterium]
MDYLLGKDFEFLKDTNTRQEEVDFEIKKAGIKRDKIIETIQKIDVNGEEIKKIHPNELEDYVNSAEKAFESINNIIRNLTKELDEFNQIEKEIVELVIKKDSEKDLDAKETVKNINNQIANFKNMQKENRIQNKKYSKLVDQFLQREEIGKNAEITSKNKENTIVNTVYQKYEMDEIEDNLELRVSERHKRVYLPYTKAEIESFLNNYPEEYKTPQDVISQEFITDISIYNKHPVLARFREAYSLSRNKEMKSAIDSLKFAMDIMFRSDINPTIIAAVKSQQQLNSYIECLESNKLENFKYFNIIFEVNPI